MPLITYSDKVDNQVSPLPEINKVTAGNMNEIKNAINAIETALLSAGIVQFIQVTITSSDFAGSNYTNANLVGLTSAQFQLFSDDGSGVLLKEGDAFTFSSMLGRITTDAGNYRLNIFKPITITI